MVAVVRWLLRLVLPASCWLDSLFSSKPGGGRARHEASVLVVNKHSVAEFLIDLELGLMGRG